MGSYSLRWKDIQFFSKSSSNIVISNAENHKKSKIKVKLFFGELAMYAEESFTFSSFFIINGRFLLQLSGLLRNLEVFLCGAEYMATWTSIPKSLFSIILKGMYTIIFKTRLPKNIIGSKWRLNILYRNLVRTAIIDKVREHSAT